MNDNKILIFARTTAYVTIMKRYVPAFRKAKVIKENGDLLSVNLNDFTICFIVIETIEDIYYCKKHLMQIQYLFICSKHVHFFTLREDMYLFKPETLKFTMIKKINEVIEKIGN